MRLFVTFLQIIVAMAEFIEHVQADEVMPQGILFDGTVTASFPDGKLA